MTLQERVFIEPRFQRAIRIDSDLGKAEALRGFVCPPSSVTILRTMAAHIAETGQSAFTWTGPYGSGKSSLVIALSALMNSDKSLRAEAAAIVGQDAAEEIWGKMPPKRDGWKILGIVGRKEEPVTVFGEALVNAGFAKGGTKWTETEVLETLLSVATAKSETSGGLIIFVDELGKLLEAVARGHGDIHLMQQIAECASRSGGRLVLVGILHQAFDEYAAKLSRDLRDEWSKIHGRFVDLPVNIGGDEQISILSKAINGRPPNDAHHKAAFAVASAISSERLHSADTLSGLLSRCWPLHPATAALLGPISRRRFGQNQRSIFSFLNSAEPYGFREFLRSESSGMFTPDRLWDYLRVNLEPAILSSPDGHRWAVAAEAIDRCGALGGEDLHMQILKAIAVIDLFRERSGLVASEYVIATCFSNATQQTLTSALKQLVNWSIILYKKFLGGYSVYAGSDFDVEAAIEREIADRPDLDMGLVKSLSGLQPILCKSHYHKTGALRWFDLDVSLASAVEERVQQYRPAEGTIGQFVLVVSDQGEAASVLSKRLRQLKGPSDDWDNVFGVASHTEYLLAVAREVQALGRVRAHPDLQGDPVARREVAARLAGAQGLFEVEITRAFEQVTWYCGTRRPELRPLKRVSRMASEFADARYNKSAILHNELLNRIKPSSSAVAAQNALLKRMISSGHLERLGIEGFPAEGGLYLSILHKMGLHCGDGENYGFVDPRLGLKDPAKLAPLWAAAEGLLKDNEHRSVSLSEIYDMWGRRPYGLKRGLMPILAVAFMVTSRSSLAFYRTSVFQSFIKDIDIDYLVKDPSTIQLRWMDIKDEARELLTGLADVVRSIDRSNELINLEPIDVGRGLVAIYDQLSPWTKRTQRLSSNASTIRGVFKKATDPNGLIFNDLPGLFSSDGATDVSSVVARVKEGMEELVSAHTHMIHRIQSNLLDELQVPSLSASAIEDLKKRAENIRELAGDFDLEAFIGRLARFAGSREDLEGLASLAASKPIMNWTDADVDKASLKLVTFARAFNKAEAYAHIKGRKSGREAMAFIVRVGDRTSPVYGEFDISDAEDAQVKMVVDRLQESLPGIEKKLLLAAISRFGANLLLNNELDQIERTSNNG